MQHSQEFFEVLWSQWEKKLPFVAYTDLGANEENVKALLQTDLKINKVSDFSESGFVFAPFDNSRQIILFPANSSREITTVFNKGEDIPGKHKNIEDTAETPDEKEAHLKLVQKGIDAIKSGNLEKVVLSRTEMLHLEDHNAIAIFKRLLKKYPTAFVYIWFHPKIGLWLGATPETLLQVERNRLKTMALAGTKKYSGEDEVEWGQKEMEEQQIVTDIILEELQKTCINLETNGPYTTRAGNLFHLRTDINGEINGDIKYPGTDAMHRVSKGDIKNLIYSIHPTPAICGHPIEEARKFILENENYDREYYTGFLGELNMKKKLQRSSNKRNRENLAYSSIVNQTALYVNLRCMKIEATTATLYVGGGITADSDPEAEWEETQNKAGTMKAVLLN
ncbi:chorismate-binding protein [soil metagenome]